MSKPASPSCCNRGPAVSPEPVDNSGTAGRHLVLARQRSAAGLCPAGIWRGAILRLRRRPQSIHAFAYFARPIREGPCLSSPAGRWIWWRWPKSMSLHLANITRPSCRWQIRSWPLPVPGWKVAILPGLKLHGCPKPAMSQPSTAVPAEVKKSAEGLASVRVPAGASEVNCATPPRSASGWPLLSFLSLSTEPCRRIALIGRELRVPPGADATPAAGSP